MTVLLDVVFTNLDIRTL